VSLSKWLAKYFPNPSRNNPQRLIAILLPIYPKQNTLLGSPSRTMQARKYQKIAAILPQREHHTIAPRTLQENTRDPLKLHFYYPQDVAAKNCSKITKKKMGESKKRKERNLGSMELH
jgi:hypothetical protein